jgi:hypothetical protein
VKPEEWVHLGRWKRVTRTRTDDIEGNPRATLRGASEAVSIPQGAQCFKRRWAGLVPASRLDPVCLKYRLRMSVIDRGETSNSASSSVSWPFAGTLGTHDFVGVVPRERCLGHRWLSMLGHPDGRSHRLFHLKQRRIFLIGPDAWFCLSLNDPHRTFSWHSLNSAPEHQKDWQ